MSSSTLHVEAIAFNNWLLAIINTADIPIDEIEVKVAAGFKETWANSQFQQLTDLTHLVCFIKNKNFSNPTLALRTYTDENTLSISKTALIKAIRMLPPQDDKIYELVCYLALNNKLERYTNITEAPPLQIYQGDGVFDEYKEWYLLFELFEITRKIPPELIPTIADLLMTKTPSLQDLIALTKFLKLINQLGLLRQDFMENIIPYLSNKTSIEKFELFVLQLEEYDLLNSGVLKTIYPFFNQLNALDAFFSFYHEELQHSSTPLLLMQEILQPYCQMSVPNKESYDDQVPTNTPLHLAIIEGNRENLNRTLAFANRNLLTKRSYENTALILACKLADKEAARLILAKMRELGCDINQSDHHGMTALHWANFYHFDELIRELINAGADAKLKEENGRTCDYFYQHKFTITDFKLNGKEIIEGEFKLHNSALSDIGFHMDKIALNLKLTTPSEIEELYHGDEIAQIRSTNRFHLFFKLFRPRLLKWLDVQNELENQSTLSFSEHHCFT